MSKLFWCIDLSTREIQMEVNSNTARDAALKAATRNVTDIYLAEVETGKIHVFSGTKAELSEKEKNGFTALRNIHSKPVVSKLGYSKIGRKLHRSDLEDISSAFCALIG